MWKDVGRGPRVHRSHYGRSWVAHYLGSFAYSKYVSRQFHDELLDAQIINRVHPHAFAALYALYVLRSASIYSLICTLGEYIAKLRRLRIRCICSIVCVSIWFTWILDLFSHNLEKMCGVGAQWISHANWAMHVCSTWKSDNAPYVLGIPVIRLDV